MLPFLFMERSRREFLSFSMLCLLNNSVPSKPLTKPNLHQVLGLHWNPTGHYDISSEATISAAIKARSYTLINPSDRLLRFISNKKEILPVIRLVYDRTPGLQFLDFVDLETSRVVGILGEGTILQAANEADLEGDIDEDGKGRKQITARDHAMNRLIPAIEIITHHQGRPVITPLADKLEKDKTAYLAEMSETIKDNLPSETIDQLIYGSHPYYSAPGDNPITRALNERRLVQSLLHSQVPIAMTEFGVHPFYHINWPDEYTTKITLRLLDTPIDPQDQILCANLWISSVLAYIDPLQFSQESLADWKKYDLAALKRRAGQYHPLYDALKSSRQFLGSTFS